MNRKEKSEIESELAIIKAQQEELEEKLDKIWEKIQNEMTLEDYEKLTFDGFEDWTPSIEQIYEVLEQVLEYDEEEEEDAEDT